MKRKAIPVKVRRKIMTRDGHRCVYCGAKELYNQPGLPDHLFRLTIEHLIPHMYGGTDDEWNLAVACAGCNSSRRAAPWLKSIQILTSHLEPESI